MAVAPDNLAQSVWYSFPHDANLEYRVNLLKNPPTGAVTSALVISSNHAGELQQDPIVQPGSETSMHRHTWWNKRLDDDSLFTSVKVGEDQDGCSIFEWSNAETDEALHVLNQFNPETGSAADVADSGSAPFVPLHRTIQDGYQGAFWMPTVFDIGNGNVETGFSGGVANYYARPQFAWDLTRAAGQPIPPQYRIRAFPPGMRMIAHPRPEDYVNGSIGTLSTKRVQFEVVMLPPGWQCRVNFFFPCYWDGQCLDSDTHGAPEFGTGWQNRTAISTDGKFKGTNATGSYSHLAFPETFVGAGGNNQIRSSSPSTHPFLLSEVQVYVKTDVFLPAGLSVNAALAECASRIRWNSPMAMTGPNGVGTIPMGYTSLFHMDYFPAWRDTRTQQHLIDKSMNNTSGGPRGKKFEGFNMRSLDTAGTPIYGGVDPGAPTNPPEDDNGGSPNANFVGSWSDGNLSTVAQPLIDVSAWPASSNDDRAILSITALSLPLDTTFAGWDHEQVTTVGTNRVYVGQRTIDGSEVDLNVTLPTAAHWTAAVSIFTPSTPRTVLVAVTNGSDPVSGWQIPNTTLAKLVTEDIEFSSTLHAEVKTAPHTPPAYGVFNANTQQLTFVVDEFTEPTPPGTIEDDIDDAMNVWLAARGEYSQGRNTLQSLILSRAAQTESVLAGIADPPTTPTADDATEAFMNQVTVTDAQIVTQRRTVHALRIVSDDALAALRAQLALKYG